MFLGRAHNSSALEEAFNRTAFARRLRQRILMLQGRLQPKLDESGWRLYLALEEALNERQAGLVDFVSQRVAARLRRARRAAGLPRR